MIKRSSEPLLRSLAAQFKAVTITGPRQSGKTTLARKVFPDHAYVSLENPDQRRMAREDPRLFLSRFRGGCILDEIQREPLLLSYIQQHLDESRLPGQYILTGSQQFGLMQGISQSLAGRTAIIQLLPFSCAELERGGYLASSLEGQLFNGAYPPIHDQKIDPVAWLNAYISTYIERDVRQAVNVRDLASFSRFVGLCAGSTGQMLNLSRLGVDCGINHGTARQWLSVLEASFIVFRLSPHHRNFRKRLVKTPKLYFYDTGLAARLLGIENADQLMTHPLRGALFETWVVSELMKGRLNRGHASPLYFWRDHVGLEVDVIAESAGGLLPVEIKSGKTLADDWFTSLKKWESLAGKAAGAASLVYGGDEAWVRDKVRVVPWRNVSGLADKI